MFDSPLYFIEKVWGLVPERENSLFVKGKHITWQQHDILLAVEFAISGKLQKRITVEAGHGIGKSTCLAWLIIWFLWTRPESQIPCTAPTSDQMHDVLWKEVKIWLDKMPPGMSAKYEWSNGYIRFTESPQTWFARAKTARKEAPEALAGVHGEFVMFIIDEASGVPDEVFNVAEGALTGQNVLVIMISNHTRLIGYFHESHNKDKHNWQCLSFNSIQSPIVDNSFVARIKEKHGEDSDEYRVRVLGKSPKADAVDGGGYTPLLLASDLHKGIESPFVGIVKMGVDPSGEGDDESLWVARDRFKAVRIGKEKISTPLSIAQRTVTLLTMLKIEPNSVFVDNFGEGANVGIEIAKSGKYIQGVNVKDKADESGRFINKRAECYWRLKEWLRNGGELVGDGWDELLNIRYRATLGAGGRIQIMPKEEMRKNGIRSPNQADALMLTFYTNDTVYNSQEQNREEEKFDPYAAI